MIPEIPSSKTKKNKIKKLKETIEKINLTKRRDPNLLFQKDTNNVLQAISVVDEMFNKNNNKEKKIDETEMAQ